MERAAEVQALVSSLTERHPRFPAATIERLVARTFETYDHAKVQTFVPILVQRQVHERLRYADGDDGAATPLESAPNPVAPSGSTLHRLPRIA